MADEKTTPPKQRKRSPLELGSKETHMADEETTPPPKKRKPIPKYLIYAAVFCVISVASYFLQKTLLFGSATAADGSVGHANASAAKGKEEKAEPEEETQVIMLEEIIVNPAETAGRRYLSVTLGLQTRSKDAEKEIEKSSALIRDALIGLLSSKHLEQLANTQYRDTLRFEIKEAAGRHLRNTKIDNVVFSGYVLQ